jgi:hypothetical protein
LFVGNELGQIGNNKSGGASSSLKLRGGVSSGLSVKCVGRFGKEWGQVGKQWGVLVKILGASWQMLGASWQWGNF